MDVIMPQLGETVAEGKISGWFKSVGDPVKAGDNLFEVETDKTAMEVPTTIAGVVAEIRVPAGETVPVGTVVAVIVDSAAAMKASVPAAGQSARHSPHPQAPATALKASSVSAAPIGGPRLAKRYDPFHEVRAPERNFRAARLSGGIPITPLARRLAAEVGIDLRTIHGSGPGGRIVARDVEQNRVGALPAPSLSAELAGMFDPASFEIIPHDAGRHVQAMQATSAKHSIPHFYLRRDVTIDNLLALIEEVNAVDPSLHIALRDCVVKALAMALTQVPDANVRWNDDHMLRFRQVDIAVGTTSLSTTRVIRAADHKGIPAIAREYAAASSVERNSAGFPGVSEVWDRSAAGIGASAAIVLPPHVTALTIGAAERRAVVRKNNVVVEGRVTLTLSCDHRAIDGVLGARLLDACAALLERPLALFL